MIILCKSISVLASVFIREIFQFAEHNASRTFNLPDRPCIAEARGLRGRAVAPGKNIRNLMETFRIDAARRFLCSLYIRIWFAIVA